MDTCVTNDACPDPSGRRPFVIVGLRWGRESGDSARSSFTAVRGRGQRCCSHLPHYSIASLVTRLVTSIIAGNALPARCQPVSRLAMRGW